MGAPGLMALFVIGTVFTLIGLLVRLGLLRSGWTMYYEGDRSPSTNIVFAILPLGLTMCLGAASSVVYRYDQRLVWWLVWPIFGLFIFSLVVWALGPSWAKPRWLRDWEAGPGTYPLPVQQSPIGTGTVTILMLGTGIYAGYVFGRGRFDVHSLIGPFLLAVGLTGSAEARRRRRRRTDRRPRQPG